MKLGFTPDETIAMFDRLRPEAAEFWNEPRFLTLPFYVRDFDESEGGEGSQAVTDFNPPFSVMWQHRNDPFWTGPEWPNYIAYNVFALPYVYEDELRSTLMHEMAHAATGNREEFFIDMATSGHGPLWRKNATEFGASPSPVIHIREFDKLPFTIEVPVENYLKAPTLGPL